MRAMATGVLVAALASATGASDVVSTTSPAKKGALNPQLVNLPDNTWVHVKTRRNPVGRSYSGVCYGAGTIFYFGGGHGSHPGNDVELYDIATNTWVQATECESWKDIDGWAHVPEALKQATKRSIGGGSSSDVLSPKGRPLTLHTYQMQTYFPEERAFCNQIGGGLWAFDPVRRAWRHVNKRKFARGDVHTQNLVYDPDLRTIFTIVSASADRGVHVYDRKTNTWSRRYPIPTTRWSEVYSTYDSSRRVHIVRAGGRWWTLDMANGRTTFIRDLAEVRKEAGAKDATYTESLSLEYDPQSTRTLAIIKGARQGPLDLWAYDADHDSWSRVQMNGEPPRGIPNWDLLVHDPIHRCFLFVNVLSVGGGGVGGRTDGLFAFRYEPVAAASRP